MSKDDTERQIMGMDLQKGPTPEQKAERDRVVALFDEDWMIDVKNQEIRRKPRSIIRVLRDFFWPRRHTVFALYWWCRRMFHNNKRENFMVFTFPIEHDNMPIPGYPMKYQVKGSWTIPKRDRKYLTKGPLVRMSPVEIWVTHNIGWERIVAWIKLWWGLCWGAIVIIATVVGLVVETAEISKFFER